MKRLLAVLLAAAIALPVAADTQVVCTITAQAQTACSALTVSQAAQLDPCRCNPTPTPTPTPEPSVYDDAVSLWKLDEASGTRADSIGSLDLTDNNTVGYANMGPNGVVADFSATTSENLTDASTGINWTGATTTAFWFRMDALPGGGTYYDLFNVTSNPWRLYIDASGNLVCSARGFGITVGSPTLSAGLWYYLVFWHDGAGGYGFSVDGGASSTTSGAQNTAGTGLFLGTYLDGTSPLNGQMARVGQWSVKLSDASIAALFAGGKGKAYADLTTAEKVGLVSYWNLDETSGNRADSHGSNTLADNNTVTSATNSYPANLPGTVASFVAANSESLSRASVTAYASYTYAIWFTNPGLPSNETLISHGDGAWNTNSTVEVYSATGNTIQARAGDGTNGVVTQDTSVTVDDWHLAIVWFDDTDKKLRVQIDDDTVNVSSALPGSVVTTASTIMFGDARSTTGNWNGKMSAAALWNRVLTPEERAALYNSGAGAPLP